MNEFLEILYDPVYMAIGIIGVGGVIVILYDYFKNR